MDFTPLLPFLVKVASTAAHVSPQEVLEQLRSALLQKNDHNNTEAIDGEIIEVKSPDNPLEAKNLEGQILDGGFKELKVENAIEKIKENKKIKSATQLGGFNKSGSLWDKLRHKYCSK